MPILAQNTLRDYQQKTFDKFVSASEHCYKILIQQPTGAGKTVIMMAIVAKYISEGSRVLILAHKVELIQQTLNQLQKWLGGVEVGVIADRSLFPRRNYEASVTVASVQAFALLGAEQKEKLSPELIIFDEAHHCYAKSWADIFRAFPSSTIVGFTATPLRSDGKGLDRLYGDLMGFEYLIKGVEVQELINQGHLVPFKFFAPGKIVNPKAAKIKTSMGDYNSKDLALFVENELVCLDVVRSWERFKDKQTVVYPVSVEYSKRLRDAFLKLGYIAEHIDADTPKAERVRILSDFAAKRVRVLCQHSIVIEGVDVPGIECIIVARPTKSLVVWFQLIGRGLRPSEGKTECIVMDFTTNHLNLPIPTDLIDWSLGPLSLPEMAAFSVRCFPCSHVYRPTPEEIKSRKVRCPNCGEWTELPEATGATEEMEKKVRGEVELDRDLAEVNFEEIRRSRLAKVEKRCRFLKEACVLGGYKKYWQLFDLFKFCRVNFISVNEWSDRDFQKVLVRNLNEIRFKDIEFFLEQKMYEKVSGWERPKCDPSEFEEAS